MANRKSTQQPRNSKGRFTRSGSPFGVFADFDIDSLMSGGKKSRGTKATRTRATRGSRGW